jgi:hypothetical protein
MGIDDCDLKGAFSDYVWQIGQVEGKLALLTAILVKRYDKNEILMFNWYFMGIGLGTNFGRFDVFGGLSRGIGPR